MIIKVNDDNFKQEIVDYKGIVLVDFSAEWCGPCKSFAPIFKEFSDLNKDVKCCEVNVDESMVSRTYKVMSIPTILMFKDGEVCDRFVGVMQKNDLELFINKNK